MKPIASNISARALAVWALNYGLLLALLLIIIVTSVMEPSFITPGNVYNIARQISIIGIVSCGMTFAISSGVLDLSVGSVISLAGVVVVSLINRHVPDVGAILAGMAVGLAAGTVTGLVLARIRGGLGASFIVTYGMQSVIAAAAYLYTGGSFLPGTAQPGLYRSLGQGFGPIACFILVAVASAFVLERTKFGRYVHFLGGNAEALRMAGVKVSRIRVAVYALSGLLAAFAAVVGTSRVNSGAPAAGVGYELDCIAAFVVGGNSILGGTGTIQKTVIGVIVIGVVSNALNILGVTQYPQLMIKGGIILLAVLLDVVNKQIPWKDSAK